MLSWSLITLSNAVHMRASFSLDVVLRLAVILLGVVVMFMGYMVNVEQASARDAPWEQRPTPSSALRTPGTVLIVLGLVVVIAGVLRGIR